MHIDIQAGRYVVAVSGGVDSMVLLYLLSKNSTLQLIVAHYDHGIRKDSAEDRRLVQSRAKELGVPFVYDEGNLGEKASEQTARDARYKFLHKVQSQSGSRAMITAHHQDDAIETAIINILRGTGRRGLTAIHNNPHVVRPLLGIPKSNIVAWAESNSIKWREDSTNNEFTYLRNYVRHNIANKLSQKQREQFIEYISKMRNLNYKIDGMILAELHTQPASGCLDKQYFNMLPYDVSLELIAGWLRYAGVRNYDSTLLHRVVVFAKTLAIGKQIDIGRDFYIIVEDHYLALKQRDR